MAAISKLAVSGLALAAALLAASPALAITKVGSGVLQVATASGAGGHVKVFDGNNGVLLHDVDPYGTGFQGGIRVAAGDVNGDGVADLVTGAGPGGGPHVKVFDGGTGQLVQSYFAYDAGFTGGVFVGSGDVNGDGKADVITGAGAGGGPHVKVFSGADGSLLQSFFAFAPGFSGGVNVVSGDVFGDGSADIIVGAGAGGAAHVKAFSGITSELLFDFIAFDGFDGSVSLATGRYNGVDALIVGAGPGGGPHVKVFALSDLRLIDSFFAFDESFTGGVNVGAGQSGRRDNLFVGMASGGGDLALFDVDPRQRGRTTHIVFAGPFISQPFGPDYMGGLNIGGINGAVPEPGIWLQLITGFGLAGAAMRSRRPVNRRVRPEATAAA